MSKSLKFQIVEKARTLIQEEQHWCRGMLARDADGLSVHERPAANMRKCHACPRQ